MLDLFKKRSLMRRLLLVLPALFIGSLASLPAAAGNVVAPTSIESLFDRSDAGVIHVQPVAKAHTLELKGGDLFLSAGVPLLCLEHGSHLVEHVTGFYPVSFNDQTQPSEAAGSMLDARLSFAIPIGS